MIGERHLYVLRHAKSSWDDPGQDDHDRPLAPRGRKTVALLAEHLATNQIHPDQVLCSSARRTRETLEGIALDSPTSIEPELYGASCSDLIERLRRLPGDVQSVMVVGHNPASQMLVLKLAGAGASAINAEHDSSGQLPEVTAKFPTGALATLTIGCDWSEIGPGCADLAAYVRPKALSMT